jgi:hypothetical protein
MVPNQQVNDNMNGLGQKDVKAGMKRHPPSNGNGNTNGHDNRHNQHLHPSLQQQSQKTQGQTPSDSTAHHHPSFQPYCKHSEADGDLHSHALGTFYDQSMDYY